MSTLEKVEPVKTVSMINNSSTREKRRKQIEAEEAELNAEIAALTNPNSSEDVDEISEEKELDQKKEDKTKEDFKEEAKPDNIDEEKWEKRYADLRRHTNKQINDLKETISALESNKEKPLSTPKTEEELLEWSKKYPDVASIIETIADKKAKEKFDITNDRLKLLDEQQEQINIAKAEEKIREKHSDFDELRNDQSFHDWADEQPNWIKDVLYDNLDDPKAVIRVLDLYKVDTGKTENDTKNKRRSAAEDVKVKTQTHVDADEPKKFSESQIKKNSDKWFEENYDAILQAQRDGRFIYDLSGSAR